MTIDQQVSEYLSHNPSALDEKIGLVLEKISPEEVRGWAPVTSNTQSAGLWHGGASAVLVETLASLGALAYSLPLRVPVGTELSVSHLRPASTGRVEGVAQPLHLGESSTCYQVQLSDAAGLIAVGRLTCRLIKAS